MTRPMVSVRETRKRIIREMNDDEFAQWKIDQAQAVVDEEKRKAEKQTREDNANVLVKRLAQLVALTESEIAELLRLEI